MNVREWGAFCLLTVIWGASFMLIKIGLEATGTFTLVALRVALGALVLWIVVLWRRLAIPATGTMIGALTLMGLFNNAVPFSLITWGETTIDSGLAAVLNGTMPLFVVIIAHLWLKDERITVRKSVGLAIGFVGVIVVIRGGSGGLSLAMLRGGELAGQLAVVLASASYAASTVFARRYLKGINSFVLAAMQLTSSTVFTSVAVLLWEWPLQLQTTAIGPLLSIVTLGVVNTGIAYMLYFFLVNQVGATRTSLVTYGIPAVGLLFGFVFLNEAVSLSVILGFLLIVAGVLLVNRRPLKADPVQPLLLGRSEPHSTGD